MEINNINLKDISLSNVGEVAANMTVQDSMEIANSVSGNVTDINDIIAKATLPLTYFRDALSELNEASLDFIEKYDEYNRKNLYDASLLKERMKDAVRKAVSEL